MKLSLFIARRIASGSKGTFSTTIHRIAIASIGLGLAVLILAFMVLLGFKSEIKGKIYSFSGHLIINKYTLSTSFEETSITLSDALLDTLDAYPLTLRYQPYAMKAGLIRSYQDKGSEKPKERAEIQGIIFKGIDQRFDTASFTKHLIAGRFPDLPQKGYSTEVILSKKIATYLRLKVGDPAIIYFVQDPPKYRKLKVVGLYETGLEEVDEKIMIGDIGLVRKINNWPDSLVGGVEVFLKDPSQMERAEYELFTSLDENLYVDKVTDKHVQIFDWLDLLNRNVVILLGIILFVSGTSIISILLILIMERTQMVGLMKALGAPDRLIQSVFVWSGMRLLAYGCLLGNALGLSLGLVQKYLQVIPLDAVTYYMDFVPIELDIGIIFLLNLGVMTLIGLTLYIPVSVVSRVRPVQAIKFD